MPYKPPQQDICPACQRAVYANEAILAAGSKFHKGSCFKCSQCKKVLESTNVSEHDGKLFCKQCHGKHFGPKGYGFGGGAGVLGTEDTEGMAASSRVATDVGPVGPQVEGGCPRCGKRVYDAEKRIGAGKIWHRWCFNCSGCKKILDSTNVAEKDGDIFCKGCYGKQFGPKGFGFGGGAAGLSTEGPGGQSTAPAAMKATGGAVEGGCPRCGKRVYEAEKKLGAGKDWHRWCFNCNTCHKAIDSTTLTEKGGEIYCKACYAKNFGPHGKV